MPSVRPSHVPSVSLRTVLLLMLLAVTGRPLLSQETSGAGSTLSGRVVDRENRVPVVGAQVRLVELNRGDLSHDDGAFVFRNVPAGRYLLRVTRIGFRPDSLQVTVPVAANVPVEIVMRAAAVELAATVVTGTIRAQGADEAVSPTTVLSGERLDRQLAATVAATLQNQPGIAISTLGPATARPVIRGLSGDRVLMLEDGLRTGDLSATSGDHAVSVDPLTSRQLEVVRGPMSLLYGSSALGGVVNVIRDEVPVALPEHVGGTLGATGTSVDRGAGLAGVLNARAGSYALRAEVTARRASDQRTPLGTLDNTHIETLGLSVGASRIGTRGHAGASYRYFDNAYGVPGGFVGGHERGVRIDMRKHNVRAEAELRPDSSARFSSVRGSVGATRYGHEEYESSGSVGTRYNQTVVQGDLLARHRHVGSITEGAIGMRYQYRDIVTGGALRTPSTRDQSVAAFVVEQFEAGPLVINAGGRYEWARYVPYEPGAVVIVNDVQIPARPRTFSNLSASLGVLYDAGHVIGHALEGVHFGASVGRAFRTPDFNELYSNGPHLAAYSYDVGNPSIRAETGLGIDVFARLSRDRVRGEVALFRNQMDDFIFPRNTGDIGLQGNRPKFQYTGRDALLTGAEGSLEVSATRDLTVDAALSYVRGTFTGAVDSLPADPANGIPNARPGSRFLPLMPPLRGHLGVQYERGRATSRSWSLGTAVRVGAAQENLGDFETESPAYALLELSGGTRFLVRGRFHAVTLRIDNATNTAWRNHLSRTKSIMPEAGRNVSLLYRVSF